MWQRVVIKNYDLILRNIVRLNFVAMMINRINRVNHDVIDVIDVIDRDFLSLACVNVRERKKERKNVIL